MFQPSWVQQSLLQLLASATEHALFSSLLTLLPRRLLKRKMGKRRSYPVKVETRRLCAQGQQDLESKTLKKK